MELCDSGHESVAYSARECPVCRMEQEKDEKINKLEAKIEELEDEV